LTDVAELPQGRFSGPADFQRLVRAAVAQAPLRGWREMLWADPDFTHWPLGELAVVEGLTQWMQHGARLCMMAADFRPITLQAPRFVAWRRQFDHRFEARAWPRSGLPEMTMLLWTPDWAVVGMDAQAPTVVATAEAARRAQWRQAWNSAWATGTPAFPASVLGL
jgi:hypothetical protein